MEPPQAAKVPALDGRWSSGLPNAVMSVSHAWSAARRRRRDGIWSSNNGLAVLDPDRRGLAGCWVAEVDLHAARGAVAVADDRVRPARHQYDLVEAVHARQAVLDDHAAARGAVDDRKRAVGVRRHVPVADEKVDERGRVRRGSRGGGGGGGAGAGVPPGPPPPLPPPRARAGVSASERPARAIAIGVAIRRTMGASPPLLGVAPSIDGRGAGHHWTLVVGPLPKVAVAARRQRECPALPPARRHLVVRSPPELVHRALARLLVLAPALELRPMAYAVARDVVERDLAHELGPEPLPHELLVGLPAGRLPRAPLPGAVRLEEAEQLALLLRLEAGCVSHDVQLPVVVVEAEDQRPDRALLLAHPERHDHGVRRPDPLDLHHPGALARPVRGVGLLRDHALGHAGEPCGGRVLALLGHRR